MTMDARLLDREGKGEGKKKIQTRVTDGFVLWVSTQRCLEKKLYAFEKGKM
jgi:hypothetical protein